MSAGLLFRFACIAAAVTLVAAPITLIIGNAALASRDVFFDPYYVSAETAQLAMLAALAIVHHAVAAGCGLLSDGRPGVVRAGWLLTGSAVLLMLVKLGAVLAIVLLPPPTRYVDYAKTYEASPQVMIQQWAPLGLLVAVVGMAIGWLMLAFAVSRRTAAP